MGTTRWIRMECGYDHHPQVLAAGFEGAVVFECLIRISGMHGLDGVFRAHFASPRYLAAVRKCPVKVAEQGINACVDVGLLERGPDGELIIRSWEKYQNPESRRKATYRQKDAENVRGQGMDGPRTVHDVPRTVPWTVRNGTEHSNDPPPISPPTGGESVRRTRRRRWSPQVFRKQGEEDLAKARAAYDMELREMAEDLAKSRADRKRGEP